MYESIISPSHVLNEQIARQIFDFLPEQNMLVVISDRDGNCWPSNLEKFEEFDDDLLRQLYDRIDDGEEPVIRQIGNYGVIVSQLTSDQVNCGYIMIAMEYRDMDWMMENFEILDVIVNQTRVIASLLEKSNRLYETQLKMTSFAANEFITCN